MLSLKSLEKKHPAVHNRRHALLYDHDTVCFLTGKGLPKLITGFDESSWAALVDSMTVYSKDRIVFRLTCGMEIEV